MGASYDVAHNTTANLDNGYLQQETVDAIENLAISTAGDRSAIAQLTATVVRLAVELAMVNVKLVFALQKNRASQGGGGGRYRSSRGQ